MSLLQMMEADYDRARTVRPTIVILGPLGPVQAVVDGLSQVDADSAPLQRPKQLKNGLVNYVPFGKWDVYAISPLSDQQAWEVREAAHLIIVVDARSLVAGRDTLDQLVKRWYQEQQKFDAVSLSFAVTGCDSIDYTFDTMKKLDELQQVLRLFSRGVVANLKNGGDDTQQLERLLKVVVNGEKLPIEVGNYDSVFVPKSEDTLGRIKAVADDFDESVWKAQWSDTQCLSPHPTESQIGR